MGATDQSLDKFIADALGAGQPEDEIKAVLLESGWSTDEVERAMRNWAGSAFGLAVPRPTPQTTAREWFFHITMFVSLMASAWAITFIGFHVIDIQMPDLLNDHLRHLISALRLPIATLIVAYPAYALINAKLDRESQSAKSRLPSPVRRWAINGLLFVAAIALLIDLIALLYGFLEGDLSRSFVGKVLLIAILFGMIFARYYKAGVEDDFGPSKPSRLQSGWPLHILSLVVLAAGLLAIQTPMAARTERIDEIRSDHLQKLSFQIQCHVETSNALPANLNQILDNPQCADELPRDPATDEPYSYRVIDAQSYEVCAVFDADTTDRMHIMVMPNYYRHEAGPVCFTNRIESIDPNKPRLKTLPASPR